MRAADRVDLWLADLTRQIGDAAYLIARMPAVTRAVEGSDAADYREQAFAALANWPLPQTGIGQSSTTLYDRGLSPVAWSGRNPGIASTLQDMFPEGIRAEDCPEPYYPLFFYSEEGRRGALVAAECLKSGLGLVTVEAPMSEAPAPALGDPPRSALRIAGKRGMTVQFLRGAEDPSPLAALFEARGDRFRESSAAPFEYFFALRAYDGQLLGVANTLIAPPRVRDEERRADAQLFAASALLLGAAGAAMFLWNTTLTGGWTAIFLLLFSGGSLLGALTGRFSGGEMLSPGTSVLPEIPGIPDSPAGALLTAFAAMAVVRMIQIRGPRGASRPRSHLSRILSGAGAGGFALTAALLLQGAATGGAFSIMPRWQVGTGIAEIGSWIALALTLAALALASLLAHRRGLGAEIAGFFVILSGGILFPETVVAGAAMLFLGVLVVRRTSRGRLWLRQMRTPLGRKEPGLAFVLALSLFAIPQLLLLPAMEWFEEESRRTYAEAEAPAQIARHRFLACYAAVEAAEEISGAGLGAVRSDTAWRLWRSAGLPRLRLASSLAVENPARTSRFTVGLPRETAEADALGFAGIEEEGIFRDCLAARGEAVRIGGPLAGEGRFRLTVSTDIRDVPLASRSRGIPDHFLLQSSAAPPTFEGRDLRIDPAEALGEDDRQEWVVHFGGQPYRISWLRTRPFDLLPVAIGWLFLAALLALVPALAVRVRLLIPGARSARLRRSFRMQLTEAFGAAVLIAVLGLSVFGARSMELVLDGASDQEASRLARIAERVAREGGALIPGLPRDELERRLARAADQLDADLALYERGHLRGASRPALELAGFLPPHPGVGAMLAEDAVLADPVLDVLEIGSFRYRIAWVRLDASERFLAVPLPTIQALSRSGTRELQHSLLLAVGVVALLCAFLLPGFIARRLAAPVRNLARATGRIADGDLDTSVPGAGEVDELRILAASVERLVRRIPRVRRRMREEATADLARRAAHDIKNALAPIQITADYIGQVAGDPRGREIRDAVREGSRDILLQVERLRRISSEFSAAGAPLDIEEVDPGALIEDAVRPYLRAPGGTRIVVSTGSVPRLRADPAILTRIVENLLQNALEATSGRETEAVISVRVHPHPVEGRVRIQVEDNGPGIPEELRERIFDPEFSTRTRGSGLGLSNSRRFAEAHRGTIRAEPRPDGQPGLLVTVELPVRGPK